MQEHTRHNQIDKIPKSDEKMERRKHQPLKTKCKLEDRVGKAETKFFFWQDEVIDLIVLHHE